MISLIIGTMNRIDAIKSCLESIFNQTYKNYEIIIIDQSDKDDTEEYIKNLEFPIIYRHIKVKGLSRARNIALRLAKGEYFCLMDDDAYYDKYYLEYVYKSAKDKRIISGYIYDTIKKTDFVNYKLKNKQHVMSLREIVRTCPSAALTFPMKIIEDVGFFDEEFGVGARYGSGEETDLILRAITKGYKIIYIPEIKLKHPVPINNENVLQDVKKRANYFEGLGALYKKHMVFRKMKSLRYLYFEVLLIFFIKKIMFFRYDSKDVNELICGFITGYNQYKSNEKKVV